MPLFYAGEPREEDAFGARFEDSEMRGIAANAKLDQIRPKIRGRERDKEDKNDDASDRRSRSLLSQNPEFQLSSLARGKVFLTFFNSAFVMKEFEGHSFSQLLTLSRKKNTSGYTIDFANYFLIVFIHPILLF